MGIVRNATESVTCFCAAAILFAAGSVAAEPLVVGFEQTQAVPEKSGPQGNMRRCGWTFSEPLQLPAGWRPNPGVTRNGEYRLIADRAEAHTGEHCIYLKGHLMLKGGGVMDVAAGDRIALRFYAKDPAKKGVAAMLYTYQRDGHDKNHFIVTIPFFTAKTQGEWVECSGEMSIPETAGDRRIHAVIVVLTSATGAYFDDVTLLHTRTAQYKNFQDAEYAGRSAAKLKDYAKAHQAFSAALELATTTSERVSVLSQMAEMFRERKRHPEEAETLRKVLELTPLAPEVALSIRTRLAGAYMASGKFERCRGVLETALTTLAETDGTRIDIMLKIATCFEKVTAYEQAVQTLVDILVLPQANCRTKVAVQFRIAAVWASARNVVKAREGYLSILSMPAVSTEDQFDVWERVGNGHRTAKQYKESRDAYRKALAVAVVNPYSQARVINAIGGTFISEKRYAEARDAYGELIHMDTEAWQSQVYAYRKVAEAHRSEKAYSKERDAYSAHVRIANSVRGRYAKSQINGVIAEALRLTAGSYWAEGRTDDGRRAYLKWLEFGLVPLKESQRKQVEARIGVNEGATRIRQGRSLLAKRQYTDARAEFEEALKVDDATPRQEATARMGCGESYVSETAYGKARSAFEQALNISGVRPDAKADAQTRIGDCYAMKNNYRAARAAYANVLAIPGISVGKRATAHEKTAVLYRAERDFERAEKEYGKILGLDGVTPERAARIAHRLHSIYR
jgi:tetratricopeptide (TPR) repeat protein